MENLIETKRCIIRPFKIEDLDDFYEYAKVNGVGEAAGWKSHQSLEESKGILNQFIESVGVEFAIELKENHQLIGSFGLHDKKDRAVPSLEIGYVLSIAYWGQGIMPEVTRAMIDYIFNYLDKDMITVGHYDYNQQSKRVIEKMGFKFEGVLRKAKKDGAGKVIDAYVYSLLKEEWNQGE